MNREIKFRASDTKYQIMLESVAVGIEGDQIGLPYDEDDCPYTSKQIDESEGGHLGSGDDWLFILNQFILMQFTGLLDKNGKEIYEGDIVMIPELYETPEMTCPKFVNWQVVFLHGIWHLQSPSHVPEIDECSNMYQEYKSYDENFEVIGNIYEHPELLAK